MSALQARLDRSYAGAEADPELVEYTVGTLLRERARTHRDVTAVIGYDHADNDVRMTYGRLFEEAAKVAAALTRLTDPGDYVALWAPNLVEWPMIQYGAALAGVVLVALNPALRATELRYALQHSGAKVLIHAERSRDYDMAAVVSEVAPAIDGLVSIGLSETRWRDQEVESAAPDRTPTDTNLPVMLQYTSGTTGTPKGVLLRHRSLINVAKLTMEAAGISHGSITINPLPMFHTAGCVIATLGPLWIGGTQCLVSRFEPAGVLDLIRRESASVVFFVPTILAALVATQRQRTDPAPPLTTCLGGAAMVAPDLIDATESVFGAKVITVFGQTELAPVLTATRPDDAPDDRMHTVGRPLPNVDCKITDPATGSIVPVGHEGEICARGYQQMIGYLHDPTATAAAIDAEGFVHTGDLGVMDERGYLKVTGRLKELIIRGGENIAPYEIEECLHGHDAVAEACVFGLPDDRLGEVVAAVIVSHNPPSENLVDVLSGHARDHLMPHKIPQRWFVADDLPRTPTGKVRKHALPDLIADCGVREIHHREDA
ncbi:class I adenylate-forming enzyme family protein [Mycobacterium sp.]|uniref:class I adenylate-forming enzyme family protein n=1 Tax=Mycobacterium sp. TaxID=1785 RepID=UPI0025DB872D|nr:class I adenylate-forming enzyme family protein [Mycobacterium sp.]